MSRLAALHSQALKEVGEVFMGRPEGDIYTRETVLDLLEFALTIIEEPE